LFFVFVFWFSAADRNKEKKQWKLNPKLSVTSHDHFKLRGYK